MVPVCSCAHQIAAFLECCRTWLLPTDWPELESPRVCGCREVRQHRHCYILNIPARSLEQAPAATKGVWSSLWLHFSYKGREKDEVLSGDATCFYGAFCLYVCTIYLSPYCCHCHVQRLLSPGCGLWHIESLSF